MAEQPAERLAEQDWSKPSNVLIFTAPIVCGDCIPKRANVKNKESQPNAGKHWRKSTLKLSGDSFVLCDWQSCSGSRDVELTNESDIRLEYDPLAIQESVCFYLESEFRNSESSSLSLKLSFGIDTECQSADNLSDLQKEFEDIRSASQRLLVGNSAKSSSISCDDCYRGVKRKTNESQESQDYSCNSDTHHLTMEDVYTQDKNPSTFSDSCSPINKTTGRRKISKPMASHGDANVSPTIVNHNACDPGISSYDFAVPRVCDRLTVLKECTEENTLVNLLFVVIQVNDTRDVQVKSGVNAGSFVALSSLVVADDSKSCFKLTLWREASTWADKISAGDFAVATSIKVGKWRKEYVGQTTFSSGFYNLHQPKSLLSNNCLKLVSQGRLDALAKWARTEHSYLFAASLSLTKRNVKFTQIPKLCDNTLVHFRGKLISVHRTSPSSSTYHFGGQQLTKITAVLAEQPCDTVELFLWGRQAVWMNQLQEGLGWVWEFQFLTAKYSSDGGHVTLHSTPRSTKSKLPPEDKNALSIMSRFGEGSVQARKFANLRDLLESKYSGLAEVEARIFSVQFHCEDEVIVLDQMGSTKDRLKENLEKLVYIGCGSCSRLLEQDQNGVYGQCSYCVVANPQYKYSIGHYYKPLTISLSDSYVSVEVDAFNSAISHLFLDFPAKTLLQRTAHAGSCSQSYVDSFVDSVDALITKGTQCKALIACRVTLDENSFIENRSFTLRQINVSEGGFCTNLDGK